jgi:2-aminoethylphosphonate-pyruvate transaminase
MDETRREPFLLTPGPLTTTAATKAAMLRDWGSRDGEFIAMNARVRRRLLELVSGDGSHVCVPLQGSGTFIVEAMIGTLVPPAGKLLVLVNGAYGRRMVRICEYYRRACVAQETAEDQPVDPGVLNPVEEIAAVVARRGRRLLIDAMSAFGALPLDARRVPFDAVVASANKCLEGVPGVAFAIVRREALEEARGQAPSLSLDLHDQWMSMEKNGQWRFTPPTHVIAAFDRALEQHAAEGGMAGRGGRYRRNCALLVAGLRALGFETLLPDRLQAPIIVTVKMPADPKFHFETFYDRLAQRGYVIYPGKLTVADSFRIGCIGALGEGEMAGALRAITEVMGELGVASGAPAAG